MDPRIEELKSKELIGMRREMSLADNKTPDLWRQFMPRRGEVKNRVSNDFISLQNYGENWKISPDKRFEKWALVEVSSIVDIPDNMEAYSLQGGKFAVFSHKGPASQAQKLCGTYLRRTLCVPLNSTILSALWEYR